MIHINNIDEISYHKLKISARLVEKEAGNRPIDKVIVFTDSIETIKDNLESIFDSNNIDLSLHVLPLSYKELYMGSTSRKSIVLEIQMLFNLFRMDLADKSSYIIYNQSDRLIEIRTKIYEPIIEGVISC